MDVIVWWISNGSGNGLLPGGNKPLPELATTSHYPSPCWLSSTPWYAITIPQFVSSQKLGDAYVHQWTRPLLVLLMACRLFGTKPLSKSMLTNYHLHHGEQTSVKFQSQYSNLKMSSAKWQPFCLGLSVSMPLCLNQEGVLSADYNIQ